MGNFGKKMKELRDEIAELKKMKGVKWVHKEPDYSELQEEIDKLKAELDKAEKEYGELLDKLVGLQRNVDDLTSERNDLLAERDELDAEMITVMNERDLFEEKLALIDDLAE